MESSDPRPASSSKADQAYQAIRERISDGTFGPGTRLVLDQLAREFQISPVPVREAVRRLEAEGYVVFQRNLGAEVARIDAAAYGQSMQTLAIIEGAATAFAAGELSKAHLAAARRVNRQMAASLADFDPVAFTRYNHEFHQILYSHCPNDHLLRIVEREWDRLNAIRRSTFAFVPDRARAAIIEHDRLLELIGGNAPIDEIEAFARLHRWRTASTFLDRAAAGNTVPGVRYPTTEAGEVTV
ncbi:MAG: GntR family transcriptional regulator [Acidimicrobiales bacterium]